MSPPRSERRYLVVLLKAWTKDELCPKLERTLDRYPSDEIINVESRVDFQFFWPWRRNWALIVVKHPETPAI